MEESPVYSSRQPPDLASRGAIYPLHHPVNEPPWPWSTANSFSDLFSLGRRALHLPRYPRYDSGDDRVGDFDYFFLRSERYLSCQAARFLLFGADFITLADPAGVDLAADISDYWSGFYREHFAGQIGKVPRYAGRTARLYAAVVGDGDPQLCAGLISALAVNVHKGGSTPRNMKVFPTANVRGGVVRAFQHSAF